MISELEKTVSPGNAVLAFGAWLTCRSKVSSFGATEHAGEMAELVALFNQHQGWEVQDDPKLDGIKTYPSQLEEEAFLAGKRAG